MDNFKLRIEAFKALGEIKSIANSKKEDKLAQEILEVLEKSEKILWEIIEK